LGVGGTVTIDFHPQEQRVVPDFISLNDTIENCAGGYAYRDAGWITCEETVEGPNEGWRKKHGYAFFVPVTADTLELAKPIVPMGRFSHEAAVGSCHEDRVSDRGCGF
jgi:secreted PhoX family phosphatase